MLFLFGTQYFMLPVLAHYFLQAFRWPDSSKLIWFSLRTNTERTHEREMIKDSGLFIICLKQQTFQDSHLE